jgi:hypothetical protein
MIEEFKIASLALKPTDTLVVKVKDRISSSTAERLQSWVRCETGHRRVLILDGNLDLSVMAPNSNDEAAT